jgi:hypothetical protein
MPCGRGCPTCGAIVPSGRQACPNCGATECRSAILPVKCNLSLAIGLGLTVALVFLLTVLLVGQVSTINHATGEFLEAVCRRLEMW